MKSSKLQIENFVPQECISNVFNYPTAFVFVLKIDSQVAFCSATESGIVAKVVKGVSIFRGLYGSTHSRVEKTKRMHL